jgi:hypothetical protein
MLGKLQELDPLRGTRFLKEVTMDKNIIKKTMLSLEGAALQSAREKYFAILLMLGSTEASRSKAMSRPRRKSPVIFPKLWTIHSTIIPISSTN